MGNKFILKKDWYLETNILGIRNKTLIFSNGHEFYPNENGNYHIKYDGGEMFLTDDEMRVASDNGELLFDEIIEKNDLDIIIEEVPDDDDNQVKRWRIQLDVTTTRKKLKEIEKIINEKIKEIL